VLLTGIFEKPFALGLFSWKAFGWLRGLGFFRIILNLILKIIVQKIVISQIAQIFGKFCFLVYSMQKGKKFASNIPVSFNSKTIYWFSHFESILIAYKIIICDLAFNLFQQNLKSSRNLTTFFWEFEKSVWKKNNFLKIMCFKILENQLDWMLDF